MHLYIYIYIYIYIYLFWILILYVCFLRSCLQDCWYTGTVTRYHKRKMRHRVEYDDGDHEWMNLLAECERVQVQMEDGLWTMVRTLRTLLPLYSLCIAVVYVLFWLVASYFLALYVLSLSVCV
jgi:hypothetical protein